MTQAAFEQQATDKKILDIAPEYGYTSPTSFNRAFQKVHGISPFNSETQGNVLNAYPPIHFTVTITGGSAMPYLMEMKQAMRMVGIRIPLIENMDENQQIVPEFWNDAFKSSKFLLLHGWCLKIMDNSKSLYKAFSNAFLPSVFQSIRGKANGAPFFCYHSMNSKTKLGRGDLKRILTDEGSQLRTEAFRLKVLLQM